MSLARDDATKIMISVPLNLFNVFFFVKSSLLYYQALVVKSDFMSSLCEENRGLHAQVVYQLQEKLKTSRPEPK